MKHKSKHQQVSRQLLSDIASGKFVPAGRLPGEEQLVKRFRVSRTTVARAIRDLQAEGVVQRRAGSGTYVRPPSSTAPAAPRARQLGLLIPELGSAEILALLAGELAGLARSSDYALLWGDPAQQYLPRDLSPEQATALCAHFIGRQVSGILFAPFESGKEKADANLAVLQSFSKAGIPVVLLDRDAVPFPQRSHFDLVATDNTESGRLVAEHLLKLGCKRIAFVTRPNLPSTIENRISGVRDALMRARLAPPEHWVHIGEPEDLRFTRPVIAGHRWDAVVCANDLTAAQFMRSLQKTGVRVPRDLRLAGFDDVKHATLLAIPLTTVHQSARDIALAAYRAMLDRIAEPTLPPRKILLSPRLVVRESCGAYLR